jgi:hypothetical protein
VTLTYAPSIKKICTVGYAKTSLTVITVVLTVMGNIKKDVPDEQ